MRPIPRARVDDTSGIIIILISILVMEALIRLLLERGGAPGGAAPRCGRAPRSDHKMPVRPAGPPSIGRSRTVNTTKSRTAPRGRNRAARLGAVALLLAALAATQALTAPAFAQEAPVAIDIPAQPLSKALLQLGGQTGLQIFFSQAIVEGHRAPALNGTLAPDEALRRLLAGTGIEFRRTGRNVSLSRPGADGAAQLAPITVAGTRAGDPPPAYGGGQVAAGGRLGLLGDRDFMETPFSTISYTSEYIQDRQAQELSRVIAVTDPAVFNHGATGMIQDHFALRGFGVENSDVALNGLYGMVPYWRITPEFIERIEVLKGPSAMLNGMPPGGSVGGSINLVTKRAGETPLARVTGTYASNAQYGTHVDLGRRFGDDQQFGIRFNGVYRDGDAAVDHQSRRAKLAALALDWRSDRIRLSADLYTNEDHVGGLNRGVSLVNGLDVPSPPDPRTLLAPDWTFSTTQADAAILRGEVDITKAVTAYASYGHSKTDFDALASSTYQVFNARGDFRNDFSHQRTQYDKDTAEAGVRMRFRTAGIGHELALAASYYHHDYRFGFLRNMLGAGREWVTNIYDPSWGPSVSKRFSDEALPKTGEVRTVGFGVADTLSFAGDRVLLTLGARRQNVVSDTFDATTGALTARYDAGATTPMAALLWKVTDTVSVYGNYIEGLSQGATAPATAVNAGEVFPPYKTKQREAGLKMDWGGFATTLSAFQIERPSSYTDPVTRVFSFGGEQRNRGLELGFFGEPVQGLRLMGGISYTQAKLTRTAGGVNEGRYATAVPQWQGKLGVEWDVPGVPGLALNGNMVSVSEQYVNADNSLSVPGRTVFDVGARYATSIAGRPLTLRAMVLNVTDKAYWAGSLSSGLGAPRTYMLSASMDF